MRVGSKSWARGLLALGLLAGGARAEGVRLPEGDARRGQLVFRRSRCARCHVIPGEDRPGRPVHHVPLGGPRARRLSDGALATEIILPSHRVPIDRMNWDEEDPEESPMPSFARALTVQDLADLVAFLRPGFPRPEAKAP